METTGSTSPNHTLVFRKFALRDLSVPAVFAKDLSDDLAQDFLALSLASFEDHLNLTRDLRRADGKPFLVQAGYFDQALPDARAALREDVHLIGMNIGLGAAVFEFALFCLSQSTLLRDFGNAEAEHSPRGLNGYPPGFWMREEGATLRNEVFVNATNTLLPQDVRRYEAALFLTILTLRFVWLHELYHAVNGHIAFVDKEEGIPLGFNETDKALVRSIDSTTLKLLELDADQSALNTLCHITLQGMENVEGIRRLSVDDTLRLGLLGAYAGTWILDEHLFRSKNDVPEDHPPPSLRRQNLIRTFASVVAPQFGDAKGLHDGVLDEITALSRVIERFPPGDLLRAEMSDIVLQTALDTDQEVLDNIRGHLAPYRYS